MVVLYSCKLVLKGIALLSYNKAFQGGAIFVIYGSISLNGTGIEFSNNFAEEGGGIYCTYSLLLINMQQLLFQSNNALVRGGAIALRSRILEDREPNPIEISGTFSNNHIVNRVCGGTLGTIYSVGECGGALFISGERNVSIKNVTIIGNSWNAMSIYYSNITFIGVTKIINNTGEYGGGIDIH